MIKLIYYRKKLVQYKSADHFRHLFILLRMLVNSMLLFDKLFNKNVKKAKFSSKFKINFN